MQSTVSTLRDSAVSTAGTFKHAHTFFSLLIGVCFAAVAVATFYVPRVSDAPTVVATFAGAGVVAAVVLGCLPWSRIAPKWWSIACIALAMLVAILVAWSGGAASPFGALFFVVSAAAALSGRRGAIWPILLIMLLHLMPLAYSTSSTMNIVQLLFGMPVYLAIAMAGYAASGHPSELQLEGAEHTHATQPLRDQLTGLHTHITLAQHLDGLQASPAATFSLVALGVDHWQALYEKHGQGSGDDIIRQIAVLLQNHSRSSDVPVRYDDNTFLLIFPGAPADIAMRLGERLRDVIEHHRFWTPHTPNRLAITVSLGVSAFPQDGATSDELTRTAMQRMHMLQQAHEAPIGATS